MQRDMLVQQLECSPGPSTRRTPSLTRSLSRRSLKGLKTVRLRLCTAVEYHGTPSRPGTFTILTGSLSLTLQNGNFKLK